MKHETFRACQRGSGVRFSGFYFGQLRAVDLMLGPKPVKLNVKGGHEMEIGKPQHEHYIEPIELPEPLREVPEIVPEEVPEKEPVKHGVS